MANRFLNNIRINDEYTLPAQDGTADQVIATDGAGNLSFVDAAVATADSNLVYYNVKNSSGSTILKGKAVRAVGTDGNSGHILIDEMVADGSVESKYFIGVLETDLDNGDIGRVIHLGEIDQFNTLGQNGETWSDGDVLWLDPSNPGDYTLTEPNGPNYKIAAAIVLNAATNGKIQVRVQANEGVHDLHDVKLGTLGTGDLLIYDTTLQVWENSGDNTTAAQLPSGTTAERPTGVAGMFRFNSDDSQFEGYDGTQWGAIAGSGGGSGGELLIERDVFTATANQTAFTISSEITASSNTQVYIDGVYQAKSNYTTSGSTITFSTGVPAGAEVEVVHFISVLSKVYTDTFIGDGSDTTFDASKDVTDENVTQVYIDGVYQTKDNYTTSGTTITFSTAPPSGSAIEVVHFTAAEYSTLNSNQFTGTGSQTDFTLTQGVTVDNSFVFIQGVYQEKDTYSISGTTLTFTSAPLSGYSIEVITVGSVSIFNDTLYVDNFNGTGSQVDYTLSTSPASENAIDVYINGLYQQKDTFSLSGSTLTFSAAPPNGSTIEVKSTGGLNNVVSSGASVTLDATPKTADFTAATNKIHLVDTTSAEITVTLPSSPSEGDEVGIIDYSSNAGTNNITVTSNDDIQNSADDKVINYDNGAVNLMYTGATKGWLVKSAANETASALNPGAITVDYLVVAGGAGGGGIFGGGGGAGGLRTSYGGTTGGGGSSETSLLLESETNYTVTVGSGGTGGNTSNWNPTEGSDSTFATITSTGGGGGGFDNIDNAVSGGSGGGGSRSTSNQGAAAVTSPVVQGYAGGDGGGDNDGGGGGGAGAVGANASSSTTGASGGDGLANSITGSSVTYAGGGAGGKAIFASTTVFAGSGGSGGGGNGAAGSSNTSIQSTDGSPNTGGGGGGGGWNNSPTNTSAGGDGGSGVVIIRYPNAYTITETTSPNVLTFTTATDGSDKVTTFTAGTNGTIQFS